MQESRGSYGFLSLYVLLFAADARTQTGTGSTPSIKLLTAVQERELCAQARLLPVHYLELKALMMREGQTKGYISRQEARSFFRLEPAKAVRCIPVETPASGEPVLLQLFGNQHSFADQ